jgi:hypothetical protein
MLGDTRPQRHGWAPGDYLGPCRGAGCAHKPREERLFIGDKRAIMCADCAYALPDPVPVMPQETNLELLQKLIDRLQRMHSMVQLPASHEAKYQHEVAQANRLFEQLRARLS